MDTCIAARTEKATEDIGHAFGRLAETGDVIALDGPLGTGKTVLARGFIRGVSGTPSVEVTSPTFTLVQPYPGAALGLEVLHADLYRIESPEELYELGFEDALERAVLLVEWPDKGGDVLPDISLLIRGEIMTDGTRLWSAVARTESWRTRLDQLAISS